MVKQNIKIRHTVTLLAFLRGSSDPKQLMPGCANLDRTHGGCFAHHTGNCLIEENKRCTYFEKAVLPTADELGLRDVIITAYENSVGHIGNGMPKRGNNRQCPDCDTELLKHQRLCLVCAKKHRRESYYKNCK